MQQEVLLESKPFYMINVRTMGTRLQIIRKFRAIGNGGIESFNHHRL